MMLYYNTTHQKMLACFTVTKLIQTAEKDRKLVGKTEHCKRFYLYFGAINKNFSFSSLICILL